ncbi:tyrosine-protein phosphatase [Mesorhizobium sp. L-8-3]|uniref:tyrosine-protein phosphatase n=1 Tax=Mesorhizobium sp. L-8-3 TaxID=2744522 RepID=UPI0019260148|nr:tyrosine-protein phosphatase [Mesorhizobium sp. L-8-3]BCH23474.1 protein-tyrosine-phosphatase [Mesorhizobium sp. L-8-3]
MDQLALDGTLNFRAVAAYPARGGRLKTASLYRSGEFHGIGASGIAGMRSLAVTTVFDLRSDTEKKRRPSPLLSLSDFSVATTPHDVRHGDLRAVLADAESTPEACASVMKAIYVDLPDRFAAIYAHYFRTVLECPQPVALHCAAGKDRTGVGVALLLDLLGVSRTDIMEDYLKTNAVRDLLRERFSNHNSALGYVTHADRLIEPVIAADPDYLAAMFATIERDFDDTESYVQARLGLSADEIDRLRFRLVA